MVPMASGPESSRATSSLPCVKMGSNPDVWVLSFCSKQIHWFISLLIVSGVYTIEWILSPPRLIFFPATRPIGLQYLWFPTFRRTWQGVVACPRLKTKSELLSFWDCDDRSYEWYVWNQSYDHFSSWWWWWSFLKCLPLIGQYEH